MSESLATKLLQAYKQSFFFLITSVIYAIPGVIVMIFGIFQIMQQFNALFSMDPAGPAVDPNAFILAFVILAVGYFLVIVGFFAGMIFSSTRGGTGKPLGFIESYVATFKLILELATVIVFAIILSFIAGYLGSLGGLLVFISTILMMLFPLASLFYVINFISSR